VKIAPSHRDLRALFLAPLLATSLLVLFEGISRAIAFGPLAFVGALLLGVYVAIVMELFALLLGLPVIILLRNRLHSLLLCVVVGAVIAALPLLLLSLLAPLPDSASVNGISTVISGRRTAEWYVQLAQAVAICSAFGAFGGGAFWRLRRENPKRRCEKHD
jgi:hypothetical protein